MTQETRAFGPDFAPPQVAIERRDDGSLILRSPQPLGEYRPNLGQFLFHWAEVAAPRTFLAERTPAGMWRTVSYAEAARAASAVAQSLIDRRMDQSTTVMALSTNSVDHALLMLGCLLAGVPFCPVSPAYSLNSEDYRRLRHIHRTVAPTLVYVASFEAFAPALAALGAAGSELLCSSAPPSSGGTRFADLLCTTPTPEVERRAAAVAPDDVAKILFTSGSTAVPKGVVNTHRMLSANQQMLRQCWPFLERVPPVLVDWLPWNHTFGGNHNFNMVLRNGGTLFVDDGRPTADLIGRTAATLREVSPNLYFSVPAGYSMLLPYLEADDELARSFLRDLRLFFYAAAALPQDLWDRLNQLSLKHLGRRIPLTSGWGSTETAPLATTTHFPVDRAGVIGLPVPGVEIKLAASGLSTELRVRGPNVTPGYYKEPELTRAAFDADGFYKTGDSGALLVEDEPERGIAFGGRLAENFKLGTGTWVQVGALRTAVLAACAPILQDLVVCGEGRDQIAVLAWPNLKACQELSGKTEVSAAVAAPAVLEALKRGIADHNSNNPASSTRIARACLVTDPPSIDANEVTDKGYINQRAVLTRRADSVQRLYADPPMTGVLLW